MAKDWARPFYNSKQWRKCREGYKQSVNGLCEREAYLIRLRYLELKRWEEICVEMNYSWKHIHRIHSDALMLLAKKDDTK